MSGRKGKRQTNSLLRNCKKQFLFQVKSLPRKILPVILLSFIIFQIGSPVQVIAQDETGEPEGRYKIIDIEYTRTTWQLMSMISSQPICQVGIDYAGYPSNADTKAICVEQLSLHEDENLINDETGQLQNVYWIFIKSEDFSQTEKIPLMEMYLDIEAPKDRVEQPYVLLKAIEPLNDYEITGIYGRLNGKPFTCLGAVCKVYIEQDTFIEYWANSSYGDESDHYDATVRIYHRSPSYLVDITSRSTYYIQGNKNFEDMFSLNVSGEIPAYLNQPENILKLRTNNDLYYLSANLINYGLVNISTCEGGALLNDHTPNACGIDASREAVHDWQNGFDQLFWNAMLETGVPSQLLKAMIQQETQFWPASVFHAYNEYGFGQLNEMGADVALRWNSRLNYEVCEYLHMNCEYLYASMSPEYQAYLRGGLVKMVNVDCQDCDYGIDLDKAQGTISIFSQILMANAQQVTWILKNEDSGVAYEDLWKLALVSYHSGYYYAQEAIADTVSNNQFMTWENIKENLDSPSAVLYVENIWDELEKAPEEIPPTPTPKIEYTPVVVQTATPMPSATPNYLINGSVNITAYVDFNENKIMDKGEAVSNMPFEVIFSDTSLHDGTIQNGHGTLHYVNQRIGSTVWISLPMQYQIMTSEIGSDGMVEITFVLQDTENPIQLP